MRTNDLPGGGALPTTSGFQISDARRSWLPAVLSRARCLLVALLFVAAAAQAEDLIRDFPIPTIVALGKELYLRDQLASDAFDALLATHPEAKERPVRGWITQADKDAECVYVVQEYGSEASLAYTVAFPERHAPKVEDQHGAGLPDFVAKRYAARKAALAAIPKRMAERYNAEVLDAPDGQGFLVYALASTVNPNEVMVGGHYRFTVSADGKVQQVDALSRSALVLQKKSSDVPKDATVEGYAVSHVVSNTPVETHVYISLLHKMPLYVSTPDHTIWKVSDGEISKVDVNNDKQEVEKPAGGETKL